MALLATVFVCIEGVGVVDLDALRIVHPRLRLHANARSGIGLTVIKSAAPVVPVRVFGTYEAYGRHITIPRPYPIAVKYGEPMDFAELRAEAKTCSKVRLKEIYQQVADEILVAIAKLEPCADKAKFP